jgi:Fur family transcriptional regulator, peroxide stress response regulator
MHLDQNKTRERSERYREVLTQSGIKLTHQRCVIMDVIAQSSEHPDAESVYREVRQQIPTISLYTVYRTLRLLSDLRLIDTLSPSEDRMRFDSNNLPHHHFICRACGVVLDFYDNRFDKLEVPDSVGGMGTVDFIRVEMRGLCTRCQQSNHES